MPPSSTGSEATWRAAVSSSRERVVCPHAHAFRAAASVSSARCGVAVVNAAARFVRGQGRDVGAATFGTGPDDLEGRDDVRVGSLSGGGAVPRLPVGISDPGQGLGQCPVSASALGGGGGLVEGRAHQRMTHLHTSGVEDQQPGRDRVLENLLVCPETTDAAARMTARSPVSSAAASSSTDWTGVDSPRLRSRNACSTRADRCSWVGSGADPPSWSALSSGGELEQCQRVAAGLDDEPIGDPRRRRYPASLLEQAPVPRPGRARPAAARRCRRGGTASRPPRGPRTPGAPGPHRAVGRRTAARPWWRGRASGRRRRRTARSAPRPRRSAATTWPPPPGTVRPRARPPRRTPPAAPSPAGRAAPRAAASPAAAAGAAPRTPTAPRPPDPAYAAPTPRPHHW